MAFVDNGRARIHWHAVGKAQDKAPPLLLVMGLGCSSAMWFRLAPLLARDFRVILMDNRGMGQSTAPHALVHRVPDMASDIAAVMDAAGEQSVHLAGLSMGGMIAQEFAINHPDRLRSLTLMATNCGSTHAVLAERDVWQLLFNKSRSSAEEALERMRPHTYAAGTAADRIEEDHLVRIANHPAKRDYEAQLYGLIGWSSYSRLQRIQCPTLVMHGLEDKLIPPQNGRILAAQIAGAQLVELADASHWLHSDRPRRVASELRQFTRGLEITAGGVTSRATSTS
ncbi:MAG: alpha/beta fold hydrolase [Rhodoferax sp.]